MAPAGGALERRELKILKVVIIERNDLLRPPDFA